MLFFKQKEQRMAEWFAVISITILATISPGPDFALVSRNALAQSRKQGIFTALGIGAGVLVHITYTLIAIDLIVVHLPKLFQLLKLLGAAYLLWLGIKMIKESKSLISPHDEKPKLERADSFQTGFLTNALNPKTSIFIVSLFVQIVDATTPTITKLAYGGFISLSHIIWFSIVAIFFGAPILQNRLFAVRHWIDRVFGMLLIVFGLGLAFADLTGSIEGL